MEYTVQIHPNNENTLKQYCNILYKLKTLENTYYVESDYDLKFIQSLSFVAEVCEVKQGRLVSQ